MIYAGFYSVAKLPGEENPCVKVTYPCYGSSNVYLRPRVCRDGSFGMVSPGAAFGRSGFYRVLEADENTWWVKNFKSLHEILHVYVDADDFLRTDHTITFLGPTILRLHYKMTLTENVKNNPSSFHLSERKIPEAKPQPWWAPRRTSTA